jgi:hypothetical protein
MGLFQSCLRKSNKVGASDTDYTEANGMANEWLESRGGVAFDVAFETTEKTKHTPLRFMNNQKEDNFEEWRGKVPGHL